VRGIDFSSWQGVLSTLAGLVLITLLGVGIRLLVMQTLQQRRERENRQINERLRTLMAAYKTLGGSFTGELGVDPSHRRDLRQREDAEGIAEPRSDRARRIRDALKRRCRTSCCWAPTNRCGWLRALPTILHRGDRCIPTN
jgi:hypothetical protein